MPDGRVGFVGTSWPERTQIAAFQAAGLRVQAICSGQLENARRVAAAFDIPEVYETWNDLIQAPSIDLVCVATPPFLHAEVAVAALEAGKHVLCEAPLMNVSEAEEMVAASRARPEQLAMMDFELRFVPTRQAVKRMICEEQLGRVLWIEIDYRSGDALDASLPWTWEHSLEQGGGMLNMVANHLLDLSTWMLGPIRRLSGQCTQAYPRRPHEETGTQRPVRADDHVQLLLEFEHGTLGTLTASTISASRKGMTMTVHGTEGALKIDQHERLWKVDFGSHADSPWIQLGSDVHAQHTRDPFTMGTESFAKELALALDQDAPSVPNAASFEDGLALQKLIASLEGIR